MNVKSKSKTRDLKEDMNNTQPLEHLLPSNCPSNNCNIDSGTRDDTTILTRALTDGTEGHMLHDRIAADKLIPDFTTSLDLSQQVNVPHRISLFPEFLLPDQFKTHLRTVKQNISLSISAQTFIPLFPLNVCCRLIETSFTQIKASQQLLSQSHFLSPLEAQYAISPVSPSGYFTRWALVNTIIALAVRFKTAPGSEAAVSDITQAFYQNAAKVLPKLILQDPSLLSLQALLAMSLFAWEAMAFVMLGTNASRMLELLSLSMSRQDPVVVLEDMEEYEMVFRTLNMVDKVILEFLNTEAAFA